MNGGIGRIEVEPFALMPAEKLFARVFFCRDAGHQLAVEVERVAAENLRAVARIVLFGL